MPGNVCLPGARRVTSSRPRVVEEVGGEGAVQRRLAVVHQRLGHAADRPALVVHQDDQLHSPIVSLPVDDRRATCRPRCRPPARSRLPAALVGEPPAPFVAPPREGAARCESAASVDSFRRDGLTFDVRDAGPSDGEPVVLLHGFPQDSAAWDRVAPALHQAGLRTLAPDQRGYSPMARPRGRGRYRLRETTADVLALLDAAGLESAHVVGHDWGGIVGLGARPPGTRTGVRTLTALSVPHPAAMAKAMVTSDQALRSYYMLVVPAAVPARAAAARRRRDGAAPDCCAAAACPTRPPPTTSRRMREPGALRRDARLVPRAAAERRATRWARCGCRRCTCGAPATPSSAAPPSRPPRSSSTRPTGSRCSRASRTGSPSSPPTASPNSSPPTSKTA